MSASAALTGSRIRERRIISGLRQVDLARQVGISASYLNLIEHNRRKIAGKLLLDIASALDVEPQTILEGAEAALVSELREVAEHAGLSADEARRAEEFAGRFPKWAEAMAEAFQRIATLERSVETLNDRVAHDPHLAASLHEVLTAAAAIRSTAGILAETPDLEADLRKRFQANVRDDSERLSESTKTLVRFLEADDTDTSNVITAQEEVAQWLGENDYRFPQLETGQGGMDAVLSAAGFSSQAAQEMARRILQQMAKDAQHLSIASLQARLAGDAGDPAALAAELGLPVSLVLRRLAALPERAFGLIVSDRAGSLIFGKPLDGFQIPRFGAACTLWPLFEAFSQPGLLRRTRLVQLGRTQTYETFSIAEPVTPAEYNRPPLYHATMLLRPVDPEAEAGVTDVGVTCRICPHAGCVARRDPSVLAESVSVPSALTDGAKRSIVPNG